jgi:outer membrane protein TolC
VAALLVLLSGALAPQLLRAQNPRVVDTTAVRLDDLIRTALSQNLTLLTAMAEARSIRSGVRGVRSPFDPIVGVSTASNERNFGAQLSGVLPSGALYRGSFTWANLPGQLQQQNTLLASIDQPLLRGVGFNSLWNSIRATDQAAAAADFRMARARVEVVAAVQRAYAQLIESHQQEAVAARSLTRAQDLESAYAELRRLDRITEIDLITAQLGATSRRATFLSTRQRREAAQDQLVVVVYGARASARFASDAVVLMPQDSVAPPDVGLALDVAMERALSGREDVEAARRDVAQARLLERAAGNALLPSLDLSATLSRTQLNTTSSLVGSTLRDTASPLKASIGFSLSRPIVNSASRADRERAAALTELARVALADAENQVRLEVRAAYRDIDVGREVVQLAAAASAFARRQYAGERERLDLGLTDIFRVLQFDEQVSKLEQSEATARASLAAAYIRLQAALGSGKPALRP